MKLIEIQDLIKFIAKSGVTEVEIEQKDFKIIIKSEMPKGRRRGGEDIPVKTILVPQELTEQIPAPVASPTVVTKEPVEAAASNAAVEDTSHLIEVKSPMIGTFYRRSSPDKDPFKNVGDNIKEGDVVCVIEAMKLFNEIESEVTGEIVKFLVEDNNPVEYDQPLFIVDPT
jgi:acetyl-CoA carboxylase biotin carboxyl carrier protein